MWTPLVVSFHATTLSMMCLPWKTCVQMKWTSMWTPTPIPLYMINQAPIFLPPNSILAGQPSSVFYSLSPLFFSPEMSKSMPFSPLKTWLIRSKEFLPIPFRPSGTLRRKTWSEEPSLTNGTKTSTRHDDQQLISNKSSKSQHYKHPKFREVLRSHSQLNALPDAYY